jgi:outer membrane lipoprotein SlyB
MTDSFIAGRYVKSSQRGAYMRVLAALGIIVVVIAGCASQRPVLYPNEYTRRVGKLTADQDIDDCIKRAKEPGAAAVVEPASVGPPDSQGAAISELFEKFELSPGQKVFVNKCLRDKGYDPVGWK